MDGEATSADVAFEPFVIPPNEVMNIAIIGGSNTGLMHGIMLKHLGHDVHIFEKNAQSERSDLAAGITTHPEFDKFMEAYDLVEGPWCVECPGVQWLNKKGGVAFALPRPFKMTSWGSIYHRLRANFDGLTSSFCPDPPAAGEAHGVMSFDNGKVATKLFLTENDIRVRFDDLVNPHGHGTFDADLVILADGANSSLRGAIFPDIEREYVGYVAFRGTVLEADLSEKTKKAFSKKLTYFCWENNYILLYIIPGANGSLEPGHRLYNWVWYHPLEAESPSFVEIMTDTSGTLHRNTLPASSMNLKAWQKYREIAAGEMCAPFAEVVEKATQPFITAISDFACPRAVAMGGRVLIVGEALNLVRPHMALSTTASAKQALLLEKVSKGEITIEQWERHVLHDGMMDKLKTNAFGLLHLYGIWSAIEWIGKLVRAWWGGSSSPLPEMPAIKEASSRPGTGVSGIQT